MTDTTIPPAAPRSIGSGRLPSIVAALMTGVAGGLLTDIVWPNVVYGYQIIVGGLAILIPLATAILPPTRRFLLVTAAAGFGVIAGIALGLNARPAAKPALVGSVEVMLGSPVSVQVKTMQAICDVQDGKLAYLETPTSEGELELGDGRRLSVVLTNPLGLGKPEQPAVGEAAAAVPAFDIRVHWTLPDGSPTQTVMSYGPGSTVSATGTFSSGSLAFSDLVVSPLSEQREPINVAGSLRWECPADG